MERSLPGMIAALAEAVFPLGCAACESPLERSAVLPLCAACDAGLVETGEPFCLDCARTGGEPRRCQSIGHLRLGAAFAFDGALRAVIHAFKFGDAPELAAALVARAWESPAFAQRPRPDLLVPVPLHPVRLRERGYDQASRLAGAFAARAGTPAAPVLARTRATRQQARLGGGERARRVSRAHAGARARAARRAGRRRRDHGRDAPRRGRGAAFGRRAARGSLDDRLRTVGIEDR
jgi:predicted amidophosphoribosyltransferase